MKRAWGCALALACLAACAGSARRPDAPAALASATTEDAGSLALADATVDPLASYVPPRERPPTLPPRTPARLPPLQRGVTSNGLAYDLLEQHAVPVVQLRIAVRAAGSAADPPERPGLAAFTAALLREGTRRRSGAALAEELEAVGSTLEVATGPDATVLSVSVLREHVELVLGLLAEVLAEPAFPSDELERLRRRELDRVTQAQQDAAWVSRQVFARAVYGAAHPYGHLDATPASLRRIDRGAVVDLHRARYVTGAMHLVAAGDLEPAAFRALLERTFRRARRGALRPVRFPPASPAQGRQVVLVERPDSQQTMVRLGNLSLRRDDEQLVPLLVANHVLGGESSSRLFMELRERRSLTYGAYSFVRAGVEPGTFQATGSVRNAVTTEAVGAFLHELERLTAEPIPANELSDAKGFLIDSFPLRIETPAEVANLVLELRLHGLPETYWDTYRERIDAVTEPQAREVARRYLDARSCVVVLVGERAAIEAAGRAVPDAQVRFEQAPGAPAAAR